MNIVTTKQTSLMSCLLTAQHGGGGEEGRHHFQKTEPPVLSNMDSSLDSLNGNIDSNETQKRPTNLPVTSPITSKSLRENSQDVEDGSLPCTPELDSDTEAVVSKMGGEAEVLENDTRQLIARFFSDFTGLSEPGWTESKALATMKRVVDDVLQKHKYMYNGMINKLSLEHSNGDMSFISSVARSLFADNITNWGRFVSLVAFGALVCQHLKERGRSNCVELVGEEISTYILTEQREWLLKNNSWDGFVDFFHVSDPEATVRNTLMAFAGFAGIGATLVFLIR